MVNSVLPLPTRLDPRVGLGLTYSTPRYSVSTHTSRLPDRVGYGSGRLGGVYKVGRKCRDPRRPGFKNTGSLL